MPDELTLGANAQDVAAPANTSTPDTTATVPTDTGAESVAAAPQPDATDAGKPEQTREVRSAIAAARRKAEQLAKAQVQSVIDRQNAFAKAQGFDTFDAMVLEQSKQKMASGEFTPDVLAPLLQPVIEKEIQARLQGALLEREAQDTVVDEMAEFLAEYPDAGIKDVTDFAKQPYFDALKGYVAKGLTLNEAYELANKAEILAKRTAAAKQATLNSISSKDHLQASNGSAEGIDTTVVPEETMRWYRGANPDWTEKQIKEHYASFLKGN